MMPFADVGSDLFGAAAVLTSLGTLLGIALTKRQVGSVQAKVEDTHDLVNGKAEVQEARIEQLATAITSSGRALPPLPPDKPPEAPS